jgi:hypothetical protein
MAWFLHGNMAMAATIHIYVVWSNVRMSHLDTISGVTSETFLQTNEHGLEFVEWTGA